MNKIVILMIMCAFGVSPALSQNDSREFKRPRTVTVRGTGMVSVQPDQARVSMQINVRGESASGAMRMTSERTKEILTILTSHGVETKDIKTTRVSVSPVYDREKRIQPPPIIGYTASNDITVLFRQETMNTIGDALDKAVVAGASNFGGFMYESSKRLELEREALAKAAGEARTRADVLARQLDAKVGRVRSITESGMRAPGPVPQYDMRLESTGAPVMTGELDITTHIDVVFELEDK